MVKWSEKVTEFWCDESLKVFSLGFCWTKTGQPTSEAEVQLIPISDGRGSIWATHPHIKVSPALVVGILVAGRPPQTGRHHLWQLECCFSSGLWLSSEPLLRTISLQDNSMEDPLRGQSSSAAPWTIPSHHKAGHSLLLSFN